MVKIGNKTIGFGQFGASDFTIHKDADRKDLYINRHKKIEQKFWDLNEPNNYLTRSFWSRYLLWEFDNIYAAIDFI